MAVSEQKIVSPRVPNKLIIVQRFLTAQIGELVTHDEISKLCGMPQQRWLNAMEAAKRELEEQHYVRIGLERGSGYRKLDAASVIGIVERNARKMRRIARKSVRVVESVSADEYQQLTPEAQGRHDRTRQIAHLRAAFLDDRPKSDRIANNNREKPMLPK